MKERELYTVASLELHLFFLRILKEDTGFPAEKLLLHTIRLADGIIRPELPLSFHFDSRYCNTDEISLELSQEVKYLNQTVLLFLRNYIHFHEHDENALYEAQHYYNYLFKLEHEKASDFVEEIKKHQTFSFKNSDVSHMQEMGLEGIVPFANTDRKGLSSSSN